MAILLAALVLSGCDPDRDYSGGGWIDSKLSPGLAKATFGFELIGVGRDGGEFQYKDHGTTPEYPKGLNIKGYIGDATCNDDACRYTGWYQLKPKGGTGFFTVKVQDLGEGNGAHG